MKTYEGTRSVDGRALVRVIQPGHKARKLSPRFDLFNHSPSGFEWGYGGSGPAQLALAILADALGDDERAVRLHQQFKFAVIARLATDLSWSLSINAVLDFVARTELPERKHG
jgi:hypothetical protein